MSLSYTLNTTPCIFHRKSVAFLFLQSVYIYIYIFFFWGGGGAAGGICWGAVLSYSFVLQFFFRRLVCVGMTLVFVLFSV